MPTIEEQKQAVRKLLASSPEAQILVGGFIMSHSEATSTFCGTDYYPSFTKNDHNSVSRTFLYVPISYDPPTISEDLSNSFTITLYDLNASGESMGLNKAFVDWISTISEDSDEPISLTMLLYISYEDGTFSEYCEGPYDFEITDITLTNKGAALTCKPPDAVWASCGELYTVKRFPMLRQFM